MRKILRLITLLSLLVWVVGSVAYAQTMPQLTLDASVGNQRISPYIYGVNFAEEGFAAEINLPVNRWGGNATTRYNWQTNTSNHASDWYFETIWQAEPQPATLPDGSNSDLFVEQNRRTGTESLIVIPMIGWTARHDPNTRILCGFSVAKYGEQQATDPWDSDCGNGRYPDGTEITGNDPMDANIPIGPSFVTDWMSHLEKYGTAAMGGVRFYNLDNEPFLWNETHRDVRPEPLSYEGLRDVTYEYASAIKAQDPDAQTVGPSLYGWTAYFYSALDWEAGGAWWSNPIDQNAHDGVPFVVWYLREMQAYEQQHGVRLLDYFDLHYYPSQPGVSLSAAGDAETQASRLRATRSLWDTSYLDESWIGTDVGEAVYLISRMRQWIDENYPGTKLAITEYNFGGLEHINGALAQADVLGIFGREGVGLATIWGMCPPNEPGSYAFRMYRNYDGAGSVFGETSVFADSSAQEDLSLYAAKRDSDGALTIIVINKTGDSLTSTLDLSGFDPAGVAEVYRYSDADLNAIQRLDDQSVSADGFTATYPANSITLFEVPPNR